MNPKQPFHFPFNPPNLSDETVEQILEYLYYLESVFFLTYENQIMQPPPPDPPDFDRFDDWDDGPPF